jgi:hypothetical protein
LIANNFLLWSITEPTPQAAITAALAAATRRGITPARILFPIGEMPADVTAPVAMSEALNVTPNHLQVWP